MVYVKCFCPPLGKTVFNCVLQTQTLKWVKNAGEEESKLGERSKVQEGQAPSYPKEAAEAPDAEKSHPVLLPFIPGADLSIDQEEHHSARAHQDDQDCHIGEVVGQQGLVVGNSHPAPGNIKYTQRRESKQVFCNWHYTTLKRRCDLLCLPLFVFYFENM